MDSESLFSDLNYLGSSGVVLSVEQKASLQSSLVTLRRDNKFRGVKLWGIIRGIEKDYFIAQGVGRNELLDRTALYSQNYIDWHLLPHASSEIRAKSSLLQGRFTGDPSFDYEHSITHKVGEGEEAEEKTTVIEMKEEERLASVVATIDNEAAVVPRGAYVKAPLGDVVVNKSYKGLSLADAKRLNYYFHFQASSLDQDNNKVSNNSNIITQSIDFLETIENDIPKGCWSVQCDQGGASIVLRSLLWLGMIVYNVPNTTKHGYFYCGTGEKNPDLLFML